MSRVVAQTWRLRSEPTTLRRWDAVLGRQVRDLWIEAREATDVDDTTPVCLETGELVQWAVGVYGAKVAAGDVISPVEHLNVEGARLTRYLVGSGWSGRAYVLNATGSVHDRVCRALVDAYGRSVVGVRVAGAASSGGVPTWDTQLTVHGQRDA